MACTFRVIGYNIGGRSMRRQRFVKRNTRRRFGPDWGKKKGETHACISPSCLLALIQCWSISPSLLRLPRLLPH
jgi:hypothetical protein